jgi:glycerate-2-kinase
MGSAIERLFEGRLKNGLVVTNHYRRCNITSEVLVAGHPIPNEESVIAARRILKAIRNSSEKALVIFVLSGGGSSLVELPTSPLTLDDWRILNQVLVYSGASIFEINLIRKYFSQIKGGKLGSEIGSRKCIAIYLSDVNPGDLSTIASGPLIPEVIARQDVLQVIDKYDLKTKIPNSISQILLKESAGYSLDITNFQNNFTHLMLGDNHLAITIGIDIASQIGYRVESITDLTEGDYQGVADKLIYYLHNLIKKFPDDKVCLISGGEVSCPVKGQGIGGRNQEFVLYSASKLAGIIPDYELAILSAGTDGIDGNSVASGAVLIQDKLSKKWQALLADNDSFSCIKNLGGLTILGPTGNNIRDMRIHLAMPKTKSQT